MKKIKPIRINLRKADIYLRRRTDISSLEEAHSLLMETDPTLEKTLETKRKMHMIGGK